MCMTLEVDPIHDSTGPLHERHGRLYLNLAQVGPEQRDKALTVVESLAASQSE